MAVEPNGVAFQSEGKDTMAQRHIACIVAALSIAFATLPASHAATCPQGRCGTTAQTDGSKPLRLKNSARKPVATSATRTVKKRNGEYASAKPARRAKPRQTATAQPALSPVAAQAFASYELARVRPLSPEEVDNAQLLASAAVATNAAVVVAADAVQVVSADEINVIDRLADSPRAVSLDSLSRDLAGSAPPRSDGESWFSKMMIVLGSVFAAVAALVRTVLG